MKASIRFYSNGELDIYQSVDYSFLSVKCQVVFMEIHNRYQVAQAFILRARAFSGLLGIRDE